MTDILPEFEQRQALLLQAAEHVQRAFDDVADWPVSPRVDSATIREHLGTFDFEAPRPDAEVLEEAAGMLREWSLHTPHPSYYGLFNPAPSFQGVLADLLVAAHNPQTGVWHHSPAAVEIERHVVRYFAGRFGLPDGADGHFTSGGSEANYSGVLLGLASRVPGFVERGLYGVDAQPVFFASEEAHHSLEKIAVQVGLGRTGIRRVRADARSGLDPQALAQAIAEARAVGQRPFAVVATAGTTNAGVVDPLSEIATVCRREELHLHVDAAWGGSAILSDRLKPQLAGIDQADSITFDPHKMLSVPMGAGMFLCRDGTLLDRAFGVDTAYVPKSRAGGMDNYRKSLQFSRRFIGLKLFMTLAALGREGYARVIERQAALAHRLAVGLNASGWRVVNDANLALVCFENPAWSVLDTETHAGCNEALAATIVDGGQAWISTTRILGRPALRACVTSYRTSEADIDALIELLNAARQSHGGDAGSRAG